jgi:hypothetical protein
MGARALYVHGPTGNRCRGESSQPVRAKAGRPPAPATGERGLPAAGSRSVADGGCPMVGRGDGSGNREQVDDQQDPKDRRRHLFLRRPSLATSGVECPRLHRPHPSHRPRYCARHLPGWAHAQWHLARTYARPRTPVHGLPRSARHRRNPLDKLGLLDDPEYMPEHIERLLPAKTSLHSPRASAPPFWHSLSASSPTRAVAVSRRHCVMSSPRTPFSTPQRPPASTVLTRTRRPPEIPALRLPSTAKIGAP